MRRLTNFTILIASVAFASGCTTPQLSPEERLSRQVMFTIADARAGGPVASGYTYAHPGMSGVETPEFHRDDQVTRIIRFHRLKKISQWTVKVLGIEAIVAEIRGDRAVDEVVQALSEDNRVETVQAVATYDLLTYNDPYFHMQNASVKGADIERVHSLATGKDVVVGVVDTGVDRTHPELADSIIMSQNFVDHDKARFDDDEHGTSVAGIIGSAANNDLGIVGVAPEVKLMVFKACWQDPRSRRSKCDSFSIVKALNEVLKQQPDILNLSLSGPKEPLIEQLLKAASDRGIIVVAAVDERNENSFPASMQEVIAVSTPLQVRDDTPPHVLLAPGTDILTTTPGATYAFRSGSSMATAYVSGVAALMKERQPTLTAEQVRAQLLATSRQRVNMIPVIDICQAVAGEEGDSCPIDTIIVASEQQECEDCAEAM